MTTAHAENDWKIRIHGGEEHEVPHVHIIFRDGSRVSVSLESFAVLAGGVKPSRRIVPAMAWILEHQGELIAEYRRLNP